MSVRSYRVLNTRKDLKQEGRVPREHLEDQNMAAQGRSEHKWNWLCLSQEQQSPELHRALRGRVSRDEVIYLVMTRLFQVMTL